MELKLRVLNTLEKSGEDFTSGAELAEKLSVSRNSVWKAVETLRADGFTITAATNRGYRIEKDGDTLSAAVVTALLGGGVFKAEVIKSVTSTNDVLKERAAKGESEGFVLIAEQQTAGKGRHGKSFYSPLASGVYFSVILRPMIKAETASLITSAASVAAARAIEEVCGVYVGIKWVNDLFLADKKVCGILTEATFDMESGLIGSAVLGIGINIIPPEKGFPEEIKNTAAALCDVRTGGVRNKLVAYTIRNFWSFYKNLDEKEFIEEYRTRSVIIGEKITVHSGDTQREAFAEAIDDNCNLNVIYDDGTRHTLSSGEVSIRKGHKYENT